MLDGGIITQRRDLELDTRPQVEMGLHRATLVFRWPDSQTEREVVAWAVEPTVTVHPAGLIVRASDAPIDQILTVRSTERAIRVLAATGPALAALVALRDRPARLHSLALRLQPTGPDGGQSTIKILTDDPDLPETSVNVITLGAPAKEAR